MAIWAEIKKAINSNISEPLNELIDRRFDNKSSIKSVQRGLVNSATNTTGNTSSRKLGYNVNAGTQYSHTYYIDITISNVTDISKCSVELETMSDGEKMASYAGELVNATTLRVYVNYDNGSTLSLKSKWGFSWQVIEFE